MHCRPTTATQNWSRVNDVLLHMARPRALGHHLDSLPYVSKIKFPFRIEDVDDTSNAGDNWLSMFSAYNHLYDLAASIGVASQL